MLDNPNSYVLVIHIKVSQLLNNLFHIMEAYLSVRLTDIYIILMQILSRA